MKKTLIVPATVTGIATTTLLTSSVNSDNENIIKQQIPEETITPIEKPVSLFKKPNWSQKLIPQLYVAKNIKSQYGNVKCLKNYFTKINWGQVSNSSLKDNDVNNFSDQLESCLLVEYYKQTYTDNKWWGEFRLIWSIKNETSKQGLITVVNIRADAGRLIGSSSAYLLTKDNSGNSWSVTHAQEVNPYYISHVGLSRVIPPKSPSLPGSTHYWGFNPDLGKICNINDCAETKDSAISVFNSWEFQKGTENSIVYWTSNVYNWLDWIFGWKAIYIKIYDVKGNWVSKTW